MSKVLEKGKVNAKFVLKICYFFVYCGTIIFSQKIVKILFLHFKQLYYAYVEYVLSNYITYDISVSDQRVSDTTDAC